MGKVKDAGILVLRVNGAIVATGFRGSESKKEHHTGRYALDLDGLRRLWAQQPMPDGHRLHAEADAVLGAIAARYGWDEKPYPTGWRTEMVPPEQVALGVELVDGALVCLPVCGGLGKHECPEVFATHERVIHPSADIYSGGRWWPAEWSSWLQERTAAEQAELRAVVDALRGVLA